MSWDEFVSGWSHAHDGFDARHAGPMQRWWLRGSYRAGTGLGRLGVTPSAALGLSATCALAVPLAASAGGPLIVLAAGLVPAGVGAVTLAGVLAVLERSVTRLGAFYRTLAERFGEACWLAALALLGARPALVAACGVLVLLHEYVRARAGAAGLRDAGSATIGDRPTRVWLSLLALLLAAMAAGVGPDLAAGVVTMMTVGWLTVGVIGLGRLLSIVRKVLA